MKKKVLIVEDEVILLNALMKKFHKEGFLVMGEKNGKLGLDRALKDKPDLILLDIIMPVMDGMTMLAKLRRDGWGKNVPVIMLTNLNSSEDVTEAAKHGAYDYLVKSDWRLEDVIGKVNEALSK
jgi:two-component system, OmpR family, alkaline phosphatase synthesis response regulator PhoP